MIKRNTKIESKSALPRLSNKKSVKYLGKEGSMLSYSLSLL